MDKYRVARRAGLAVSTAVALGLSTGCSSTQPQKGPDGPGLGIVIPGQGQTVQTQSSGDQLLSSEDFGWDGFYEGAKNTDGTDRATGKRIACGTGNFFLRDIPNGIPYLGMAFNDHAPRRDINLFEGYFGWNAKNEGLEPKPWDLTTLLVGVARFPLHLLDRGLMYLEQAAYGDPSDRNYVLGGAVSFLREPFKWSNGALRSTANNLVLGTKFMDLITYGYGEGEADKESVYALPGEAIGRQIGHCIKDNGLLIYAGVKAASSSSSSSSGGSTPTPFIDIPQGDGIE